MVPSAIHSLLGLLHKLLKLRPRDFQHIDSPQRVINDERFFIVFLAL
jgi:hypothetical protein